MEPEKLVKKVLDAVRQKVQDELSSFLGQEVQLVGATAAVQSGEPFYEQFEGQQVVARLGVEGDREGQAYLQASLPVALRLGGTLIMLPEEELQARIDQQQFGEDEADAFGEIINIVAGVVTATFNELFPQKLRFIKQEHELFDPLKALTTGESPLSGEPFWHDGWGLTLAGKDLGGLSLVMPAELLGLGTVEAESEADVAAAPAEQPAAKPGVTSGAGGDAPADPDVAAEKGTTSEAEMADPSVSEADPETAEASGSVAAADVKPLSEKLLGRLLDAIDGKICDDVGGFLGQTLTLKTIEHISVSRNDLFERCQQKQAMARLKIEGENSGEGLLLADLSAAIPLGGTLIMLPEDEIAARVEAQELGSEDNDAFGELANIIAGVWTSVFNDLNDGRLRFVKTGVELIDPQAVVIKEEFPTDAETLYVDQAVISLDGKDLGTLVVAIPQDLLGLEVVAEEVGGTAEAEGDGEGRIASDPAVAETGEAVAENVTASDAATTAGDRKDQPTSSDDGSSSSMPAAEAAGTGTGGTPLILVLAESEAQAETFLSASASLEVEGRFIAFSGDHRELLRKQGLRGVVLVMDEVKDQGIAAAIKIRAAAGDSLPMIAAGPNWTRSMVLRAVKYGIKDILVTPASEAQIEEKLRHNLVA